MDVQEVDIITNLINTVGFPIVICLILIWFIKNTLVKLTDSNIRLSESINENTSTIKMLIAKMGSSNHV